MRIKEDMLQYIWKYRLFEAGSLTTKKGAKVHIANTGLQNQFDGPDFKNAKVYINQIAKVGNVEIHVDPSDWYAHGHHLDENYNSVILHVSLRNGNVKIINKAGDQIPELILYGKIDRSCLLKYDQLLKSSLRKIPCENMFHEVKSHLNNTLPELLHHRILIKSKKVARVIDDNNGDYRLGFIQFLIMNFGMRFNNEGFHALSSIINPQLFQRDVAINEAMLLGQAGFLKFDPSLPYEQKWFSNYRKLKLKWHLKEMHPSNWKFARLRPNNFPTVRIAQLSSILKHGMTLWEEIINANDHKGITNIIDRATSEYWDTHYIPGKPASSIQKHIGQKSVNHIIINVIAPFYYHYGNVNGSSEFIERSLNLLYECKPEDNAIVSIWKELGLKIDNAAQTQALIHLKTEFCEKFRCLECMLGRNLLRKTT